MQCVLKHPDAMLPTRATSGSVGYDLYATIDVKIASKQRAAVDTGVGIKLPDGYYGRIAPRSGLMRHHGVDVGAGVIDQDYRGCITVILFNHGDRLFEIKKHDRIAQLVIERVITPELIKLEQVEWDSMCALEDDNKRGVMGFGSTGGYIKNQ